MTGKEGAVLSLVSSSLGVGTVAEGRDVDVISIRPPRVVTHRINSQTVAGIIVLERSPPKR